MNLDYCHLFISRQILCKLLVVVGLLLLLVQVNSTHTYAQGKKTRYEHIQEKKNKLNRRYKRRGDKGKSNSAKLRSTKFKTRSRQGERSYRGDITGRRVVTKTSPRRNVNHAQPNPYAGRKKMGEARRAKATPRVAPKYSTRERERAWSGNAAGRAISRRSQRTTYTGKKSYQGNSVRSASRDPERPQKVKRIKPRSASGAYRIRRRKNPYSFRRTTPWEKAYKGDITGRKMRLKGSSVQTYIQKPPRTRFSGGGAKGDKQYSGNIQPGYLSSKKQGERAWKNDISGRKLRKRTDSDRPKFGGAKYQPYFSKKRKGDKPFKGRLPGSGFRSASRGSEVGGKKKLEGRGPQTQDNKIAGFHGNIKGGKPIKGGGSISGRRWNNRGRAVEGRGPKTQDNRIAGFQGNVKGGRPVKGGGSVSGKTWNNKGRAVEGRGPRSQDNKIAGFQGNLKGGRPAKGGGSISGRTWNNKGRAVEGRGPRSQDNKIAGFQGNLKGGRPAKGGGSISGKTWNNKGRAVEGRGPRSQDTKIAGFHGNIKAGRPAKGGGSISGKRWNNKGQAIQGRGPKSQDNKIAGFHGNIKAGKPAVGGGSISGKRWNNKGKAIEGRGPRSQDTKIAGFQGKLKGYRLYKGGGSVSRDHWNNDNESTTKDKLGFQDFFIAKFTGFSKAKFKYKRSPHAADEALKKRNIGKNEKRAGNFQGRTKSYKYVSNKAASDESIKKRAPGDGYIKSGSYTGGVKQTWKYKSNKLSAEGAIKGRVPGKAAMKAGNFQGNVKMNKGSLQNRHPSYKYVSTGKNGKEEKKNIFNLKLLWTRLFKKEENQPEYLKGKDKRGGPRYDKREQGLWND